MTTSLFSLAQEVGQHLITRSWKLVTAESCTGGGLAYWITSVAGSSGWFDRGFVTYHDGAKQKMLGIDSNLLQQYSAYSEHIALAMAEKALALSQAQISIGITGVAGPTGGSSEVPVGTVWIAVKSPIQNRATRYQFEGDRFEVREKAIREAMLMILAC